MWIKAEDGGVYNLDFAYVINARNTDAMRQEWEVYAIFTVAAALKYKAGAQAQSITLFTAGSEEEARKFLYEIVGKLGAG